MEAMDWNPARLPPGAPGDVGEPAGFRYVPDVVSEAHERELLPQLAGLAFQEVRMHGVAARRTVVHYGWDYAYESWRLSPGTPLVSFLEPLRETAAAVAGLSPETVEQVLVARYPPGAGIGWHRDAPMFGPIVVGVSLGAPCVLRFRRGDGGARAIRRHALAPRSAYVLSGAARASWQHSIPPVTALRYSVTFRTLRARRRD
jgi:alkylated DNA repair dioxygenase AlkB